METLMESSVNEKGPRRNIPATAVKMINSTGNRSQRDKNLHCRLHGDHNSVFLPACANVLSEEVGQLKTVVAETFFKTTPNVYVYLT